MRDLFFSRPLPFKDVDVPELGEGVKVRVKRISAKDKVRYLTGFWKSNGTDGTTFDASGCRARLLILSCFHPETDERIFNDEDGPRIEAYDAEIVERLAEAADELSGLNATIDELREGFKQARTFETPTPSPTA